jgi:hypothetical protein
MPIGTVTADLGSVRLLHGDGSPCSTVDLSVGQSVGAMVVRGAPGEAWTVRDIVFS